MWKIGYITDSLEFGKGVHEHISAFVTAALGHLNRECFYLEKLNRKSMCENSGMSGIFEIAKTLTNTYQRN